MCILEVRFGVFCDCLRSSFVLVCVLYMPSEVAIAEGQADKDRFVRME